MPDQFIPGWVPSTVNAEFNHRASEAAFVGDLAWWDSANHVVRSAVNFADGGNALLTQQQFAAVFAGVFASKQLATDAVARNARLIIDHIWEFPCASNTFVAGDFLGPTYTGGVLSNQQLSKVNDPSAAIARTVKEYQSATTLVKCRISSITLLGKQQVSPQLNVNWEQAQLAAPSAGSFTIFTATRAYRISAANVIFSTASSGGTLNITKDTGTTVPGGGTAILTGTMSLSGVANTLVTGTLVATAATLTLAAGDRLAVTFGGTLTNLAGCVITVALTPV